MTVGDRLRSVRRFFKLTQKGLSKKLECTQSAIADYENGRIMPSAYILTKIANQYNVDLNWLLTGAGNMLVAPLDCDSCNNKEPAHAREKERIKELESQVEVLKKNIQDLEEECNAVFDQNKDLSAQLHLRLQELLTAKDALIKALS